MMKSGMKKKNQFFTLMLAAKAKNAYRTASAGRRAERAANSAQGGVFDCIRVKCKKKCRNSLMLAAGDEKTPSTN